MEEAAAHFGYQIAARRGVLVTGGAVGVDSAAVRGALRLAGGKVICVLPVSLDSNYVRQNIRLREEICAKGGLLLTEYFSQRNPFHGTFLQRNRLITGLSRGVVIVQAAAAGGGLLYASRALEQDRDVYVFPGVEGTAEFAGSARLLQEGAQPVTDLDDVLEGYLSQKPLKPAGELHELFLEQERQEPVPAVKVADLGAGLPAISRAVWQALGDEPKTLQELAEATGVNAGALMGVLTELELDGLAVSLPGKRYCAGRG